MGLYDSLKPILFRLDPEYAHNLGLKAIQLGLVRAPQTPGLTRTLFGVTFPNPVGLAAGFDKNGVALHNWANCGFGFVEVGTVTRHPQPGNRKPRLFRLPAERALINRLGFNNQGAEALAARLENRPANLVVGVNLGKSKITPLEEAAEDYAYSYRLLQDKGDYFVVNVSSPNTPGLRSLQDRGPLTEILSRLKDINPNRPLFVKIAPDLTEPQIEEIAELANELDLTGIIATNTTLARTALKSDPHIEGGLSGAPLTQRSRAVLTQLRALLPSHRHLISVGGIMDGPEAVARLQSGASLIQIYSGWVYGGPVFPSRLAQAIKDANAIAPD